MDVVLVQDEIEAEPIHDDIQRGARAPAGGITKSLHGHDPAERRIKKIYEGYDPLFRYLSHPIMLRGVC